MAAPSRKSKTCSSLDSAGTWAIVNGSDKLHTKPPIDKDWRHSLCTFNIEPPLPLYQGLAVSNLCRQFPYAFLGLLLAASSAYPADWPSWRGPGAKRRLQGSRPRRILVVYLARRIYRPLDPPSSSTDGSLSSAVAARASPKRASSPLLTPKMAPYSGNTPTTFSTPPSPSIASAGPASPATRRPAMSMPTRSAGCSFASTATARSSGRAR